MHYNPFSFFKGTRYLHADSLWGRYFEYTFGLLFGHLSFMGYRDDSNRMGLLDYIFFPFALAHVSPLVAIIKSLIAAVLTLALIPIVLPFVAIYHYDVRKELKKVIGEMYVFIPKRYIVTLSQDPTVTLPESLADNKSLVFGVYNGQIYKIQAGKVCKDFPVLDSNQVMVDLLKDDTQDEVREMKLTEAQALQKIIPYADALLPVDQENITEMLKTCPLKKIKQVDPQFSHIYQGHVSKERDRREYRYYFLTSTQESGIILPCESTRGGLAAIQQMDAYAFKAYHGAPGSEVGIRPLQFFTNTHPWGEIVFQRTQSGAPAAHAFLIANKRANAGNPIAGGNLALLTQIANLAGLDQLTEEVVKQVAAYDRVHPSLLADKPSHSDKVVIEIDEGNEHKPKDRP